MSCLCQSNLKLLTLETFAQNPSPPALDRRGLDSWTDNTVVLPWHGEQWICSGDRKAADRNLDTEMKWFDILLTENATEMKVYEIARVDRPTGTEMKWNQIFHS